jgi:hypothetical protein
MRTQVLDNSGIAARPLMAIPLRTSFSYRGLNCPREKSLGHCTGEKPIPLLDDENKRVDKPEIDIVPPEMVLWHESTVGSISIPPRLSATGFSRFCNHMPTERASTVVFEMYTGRVRDKPDVELAINKLLSTVPTSRK